MVPGGAGIAVEELTDEETRGDELSEQEVDSIHSDEVDATIDGVEVWELVLKEDLLNTVDVIVIV